VDIGYRVLWELGLGLDIGYCGHWVWWVFCKEGIVYGGYWIWWFWGMVGVG